MVTLYRYPREHWVHLRTVNVVESPFAALRLRTDAAKRYKRSDRATAVIWKMLMVAEQPLPLPERARTLLAKVYAGVRYVCRFALCAQARSQRNLRRGELRVRSLP
jgi:putative transposase